mmetsp:Transcript_288/g.311  ORF Transcript_288/g.311 Transcript_288/m.311 type:complete len:122 (-) Transcript_288:800-1165(-)
MQKQGLLKVSFGGIVIDQKESDIFNESMDSDNDSKSNQSLSLRKQLSKAEKDYLQGSNYSEKIQNLEISVVQMLNSQVKNSSGPLTPRIKHSHSTLLRKDKKRSPSKPLDFNFYSPAPNDS